MNDAEVLELFNKTKNVLTHLGNEVDLLAKLVRIQQEQINHLVTSLGSEQE